MKKLTFFVSSLLLSLSVSTTALAGIDISSYSIDDLRYLAKQINARITELEKMQNCFVSNESLSLGDGEAGVLSDDVRKLQDFLREKGFFQYKSTGYFGKMTRASVIAYQASNGIAQTGEFDQATREKAHGSQCKSVTAKNYKANDDWAKQEAIKKEELMKKEELKKKETYYPESKVQSISLMPLGESVSWVTMGTSQYGYKVTWSKQSGPTYPPRDGDRAEYYDNQTANKAPISDFAGAGTYYVRVCEYLQGKCGVYSNEVTVELR